MFKNYFYWYLGFHRNFSVATISIVTDGEELFNEYMQTLYPNNFEIYCSNVELESVYQERVTNRILDLKNCKFAKPVVYHYTWMIAIQFVTPKEITKIYYTYKTEFYLFILYK